MVQGSNRAVDKESNKRLNSLILVAWEIWKHRIDFVFNGVNPSVVWFLVRGGASKFSEFLRSLSLVA